MLMMVELTIERKLMGQTPFGRDKIEGHPCGYPAIIAHYSILVTL